MKPKLSVIVPVYKAEKYLDRCILSILGQTMRDFELILVDDGSPDKSGLICDEYAKSDFRVKVLHKENGGVSSARNAGIEIAEGDFLSFVDSDDYVASDMYEKLFSVIDSSVDIAVCDFMMHYADVDYPKETLKIGTSVEENLAGLMMSEVGTGSVFLVTRRTYWGDLRYPLNLRNGEDMWLMIRLLSGTSRIVKVNEPLYYYNQENTASLTHSLTSSTDLGCLVGYDESKEYLENKGLFQSITNEWYWSILRFKSTFVMTPSRFKLYRNIYPEANSYVSSCPLLSGHMKSVMTLLDLHLDFLAAPIVWLYKLKCVTRI